MLKSSICYKIKKQIGLSGIHPLECCLLTTAISANKSTSHVILIQKKNHAIPSLVTQNNTTHEEVEKWE